MEAVVADRVRLCRDHYRLTLHVPLPLPACPGQFLHLGLPADRAGSLSRPFLRRAFSIAGLRSHGERCAADVIYRVCGVGTQWMASLRSGDAVSVLGPLGRGFTIIRSKPVAWLVAGGVGLPPVLWLAEHLHQAGKATVAFYGARTRDLVPLTLSVSEGRLPRDGVSAMPAAEEFVRFGTPVVLSTDDGSVGFRGTIGDALAAYGEAWNGAEADMVVYCCGPEAMMAGVAQWCATRDIVCYVCLEREMACGTGTCQSCAVKVRDADDPDGWRYALCCAEGPVFDAREVVWG